MTIKLYEWAIALKILFRQLYLSVSSSNFYYDVHKHYKGYGIKYLFVISAASSMIYVLVIFNAISNLKDYLVNNKITENALNIEYIMNQLPVIFYDEGNISIDQETPFYLYDSNNSKIGVIDPENSLSYKEKIKIPIIFTKSSIIFSLSNNENFSLYYKTLFPQGLKIITVKLIKDELGKIVTKAQGLFIYLGMPLLILVRFIINIFENFFVIILIYLVSKMLNIDTSLKTSIRLAMFSSGALVLLRPLFITAAPMLVNSLWILLIWTNILVLMALMKLRKESYGVFR
jgi:Protein of unknown function (DUF1189)